MNKKIKVIELTNKIYANLDVPEKVKYADKKYEYSKATQDYKSEDGEWLFQRMHTFFGRWLEREVEILEDEEEIDIQGIGEITYKSEPIKLGTTKRMCNNANDYMDAICISLDTCGMKINKLVEAVKQLDKNKVDYIQPYKEY